MGEAKAKVVGLKTRRFSIAIGGAAEAWKVAPRPAPNHPQVRVADTLSRVVARCIIVVWTPNVFDPIKDMTMHVVGSNGLK